MKKLLTVIALLALAACNTTPEIDYTPRLESVVNASRNFIADFDASRETMGADRAEASLKNHILYLQDELRKGAEVEKRLVLEAKELNELFREAEEDARKWRALEVGFWTIVAVISGIILLAIAGWIYKTFSPAGATGGILSSILKLFGGG